MMNKLEIDVTLPLDQPYDVVRCRLVEALSDRTCATVEIASTEDLAFEGALGKNAAVALNGPALGAADGRRWTLTLGAAQFVGESAGAYRYELELFDPLWRLGFTRDIRVDQTDPDDK